MVYGQYDGGRTTKKKQTEAWMAFNELSRLGTQGRQASEQFVEGSTKAQGTDGRDHWDWQSGGLCVLRGRVLTWALRGWGIPSGLEKRGA